MAPLFFMFGFLFTSTAGMMFPQVNTPSGRVRGRYVQTRDERTVMAFLGVPFAKPPVGNLRFEPPQPVEPWRHEFLAVSHPPPCLQPTNPMGSEDCLYLDIYTPDTDIRHRYPVIVFFHGGSLEVGAANQFTHEFFLDEDVVLVVAQYRLGLFGFLSTNDEVVPGNMGFKDNRCALRWLKHNIRSFGGDPHRVTIMGQSAGAVGVHYLMLFSSQENLFWAGISESGAATLTNHFHPPEEVKTMVTVLSQLSGCPNDSLGFVQCLKAKPELEVMGLYSVLYKDLMYSSMEVAESDFLPVIGAVLEADCVEDRLVTDNPWHVNTSVPWLVGVNSKEVLFILLSELGDKSNGLFLTLNQMFDYYFPLLVFYQSSQADGSQVTEEFRRFYLDSLPISREILGPFVDGFSDALINYGVYEAIMRADKEKSYFYYFDYIGKNQFFAVPPDDRIGACHTDELWLLFLHPYGSINYRQDYLDENDNRLSKTLVKMWTNFASCLDPTPGNSSDVEWKTFSEAQRFLKITQEEMSMDQGFLSDRMAFWRSQPFPYRDDHFHSPSCSAQSGTLQELYSQPCLRRFPSELIFKPTSIIK